MLLVLVMCEVVALVILGLGGGAGGVFGAGGGAVVVAFVSF